MVSKKVMVVDKLEWSLREHTQHCEKACQPRNEWTVLLEEALDHIYDLQSRLERINKESASE